MERVRYNTELSLYYQVMFNLSNFGGQFIFR